MGGNSARFCSHSKRRRVAKETSRRGHRTWQAWRKAGRYVTTNGQRPKSKKPTTGLHVESPHPMASPSNASTALSMISRALRLFRPSHQHTELSATFLLMTTILASRLIGYLREMYIAYAFGAGSQVDAYVAAFTLPDWLNYIVAGGTASITFIAIYTRFVAENREHEAQKTFSIIITVMTTVLLIGIGVAEIFTAQFVHWMFHGFNAEQVRLCVFLT